MFANCLIVYFFLSHNLIWDVVPDSLGFSSAILNSTCLVVVSLSLGPRKHKGRCFLCSFSLLFSWIMRKSLLHWFSAKIRRHYPRFRWRHVISGWNFFFLLASFDAKLVPLGIGESAFSDSTGSGDIREKPREGCNPAVRGLNKFLWHFSYCPLVTQKITVTDQF